MLSSTTSLLINSRITDFFAANLFITEKWNALTSTLMSANIVSADPSFARVSTISLSIFSLNVMFLLGGLIIFYTVTYGLKTFKNISSGFDINFTLFSYFGDLEEEMGAADDALFFFLIISAAIIWFFLFNLFSAVLLTNISWILALVTLSIVATLLTPAAVLKHFGIAFVAYVRGHGRTTSLFYEGVLDIISVSIIFLRFVVQNMRFIFIFFTFFELYEYIYLTLSPITTLAVVDFSNYYWSEAIASVIYTYGMFLYSVGHATIIFIAQLSIYFALSFWLFFFLYTTFTLESSEKYFFNKRVLNA